MSLGQVIKISSFLCNTPFPGKQMHREFFKLCLFTGSQVLSKNQHSQYLDSYMDYTHICCFQSSLICSLKICVFYCMKNLPWEKITLIFTDSTKKKIHSGKYGCLAEMVFLKAVLKYQIS